MAKGKLDLLLIEDDEVDREAVHRLLDSVYTVRSAATGHAGLEMVQARRPDGVLLDYRLPDVEKLDLLTALVSEDLPVVILTIEESPDIIVGAMKAGAQDYIVKKHMSQASLERAITNAIEKVALRRDNEAKQRQLAQQAIDLAKKNQQVRELASALTLAEQRERRRISQILHDDMQQLLHGMYVRAQLIGLNLSSDTRQKLQDHFDELNLLIDKAINAARTLSVELSPPVLEDKGLGAAFEWLVNHLNEMHQLNVELKVQGDGPVSNDDLQGLIVQLVRELLFNVVKHAKTDRAQLELLNEGEWLIVRVQDEGVGFDAAQLAEQNRPAGFGLYSVKERLDLFGGRLDIDSSPGKGTRVTITVPKEQKT